MVYLWTVPDKRCTIFERDSNKSHLNTYKESPVTQKNMMKERKLKTVPFGRYGRTLQFLTLAVSICILGSGIIHYLLLPERVPVHFGWSGKPGRYGSKTELLFISILIALIPLFILFLVQKRFKIHNKASWLINLPSAFTRSAVLPSYRQSYWFNRYFEVLLEVAVLLSAFLLYEEWIFYFAILNGGFGPHTGWVFLGFPVGLIIFIFARNAAVSKALLKEVQAFREGSEASMECP